MRADTTLAATTISIASTEVNCIEAVNAARDTLSSARPVPGPEREEGDRGGSPEGPASPYGVKPVRHSRPCTRRCPEPGLDTRSDRASAEVERRHRLAEPLGDAWIPTFVKTHCSHLPDSDTNPDGPSSRRVPPVTPSPQHNTEGASRVGPPPPQFSVSSVSLW